MNFRTLTIASSVFVLLILMAGGIAYWAIFGNNFTIKDSYVLKIQPGSSFDEVFDKLKEDNILSTPSTFSFVSKLMNYKKESVPSGIYKLKGDYSNKALIGKLRSGDQDAIDLTFNNVRNIQQLSGRLAEQLAIDSIDFLNNILSQENLVKYNKDSLNIMTLFIPNTYKVFWDVSAEELINKLSIETNKFWNSDNRMSTLQNSGLSIEDVYSLAAIVEKESQNKAERPTIAGVYLNRIKRGILLQADPTVVFANNDFTIKRVLNKHLAKVSPFNTYLNPGIPPGPIYMPSINSIESVLNPQKHNYLYFCAKPDYSGQHAFAKSLVEHNKNAKIYQRWLTKQNIMK